MPTPTLNDQAKIQRTLRLLMLLAGRRWYTASEVRNDRASASRFVRGLRAEIEVIGL